jgi:nucleoside-diphosphate-sugar epimerase
VTGATGFIGRRLLHVLREQGYAVRALARSAAPADAPAGVTWVRGDLDNRAALAELLRGATAVVHLAGAIKALSRAGFFHANETGAANVLEAAAAQGVPPRFIHISSLAAREPRLSPYAASKAAAEDVARRFAARLPVTILRPPAVYGPADPETLRIFRMAARGVLAIPSTACRLSLCHVDDAAAAILAALNLPAAAAEPLEFDDGRPGGYAWTDVAAVAARVLGRPVRTLTLPSGVLYGVGALSGFAAQVTRRPTVLTRHKVAEILHQDWVVRTAPIPGYRPAWTLAAGLQNTAAWAASEGLVAGIRNS